MPNVTAFHAGRHLSEKDLLPPHRACLFCGSERRRPRLRLQADPEVMLLECLDCHGRSASHLPLDEVLDDYYASYYGASDGQHVTFDDTAVLVRRLLKHAREHGAAPPRSILDFGGGDGTIALAVADELASLGPRPSVTVVDYTPPREDADVRFVRELDDVSGSYDFVMASAVLEHLTRPSETLDQLGGLVSPGGLLYVRTPDVAGLVALAARVKVSIDFTYPGHLHDLGQAFWETVADWWPPCREGRLRLVSSRPSPVETSLRRRPLRSAAAYVMKAPWWVLRSRYALVGGWEAVFRRVE